MAIKYKGDTSKLLTELSLELNNTVDLKTSEMILKSFFQRALINITIETKIEIVSNLPVHIKPFCQKSKEALDLEHSLFYSENFEKTVQSIFKVLSNYVSKEILVVVYNCFPSSSFSKSKVSKALTLAA